MSVTCVTCRDVSLACEHLAGIAFISRFALSVRIHVFGFAFAIRDTIGHGMTWGDVTTNSFAFSRE